jgi:two-component system, LytTR family, sensor kinase
LKNFFKDIFSKQLLIGVAIVTLVPPAYFYFGNWVVDDWAPNSKNTIDAIVNSLVFSFGITFILFVGNTKIITYFEKYYPWNKAWKRRLAFQSISMFVYTTIITILVSFIFLWINPDLKEPNKQLFQNITITNVITIIVTLVIEAMNLFKRWKTSLTEAEVLKRESIQAQLGALKGQLNPHFMFNSLNALSSLVKTDANKAEEFINEFSKIYRYVLDVNENQIVSVKNELKFIESFIYLNKIRFEENLQINIHHNAKAENGYIPPLALQLVIENCIKHNVISKLKPLVIHIKIEDNFIEIKNNLQVRDQQNQSTGVGQKNLIQGYKILDASAPSFSVIQNEYVAVLPIIFETA